jgi:hypothetical protein
MASTTAPKGLSRRGNRFWRAVQATYELDLAETELLIEVCRTLDLCEQLQAVLDRDGLQVDGSTGQRRVHPAVGELRASRQVLGRLLAQLQLPDDDDQALPSPAQARSRKAAHARWDRTAAVRDLRRNGSVPDGA